MPRLIADINATPATVAFDPRNPGPIVEVGTSGYFVSNGNFNTPIIDLELWKSDGTATGTVLVKDIRAGAVSSYITNLTNVDGTLFFSANDGINGQELWKSDGTAAGTLLVKDIAPGATSSTPSSFVNVGGTLFFVADDGVSGAELWKSDGTANGTILVKDINLGAGSSSPANLTNVSGTLFFAASDGVGGTELWTSDGAPGDTVLVDDINVGAGSSSPNWLTNVSGTLFFSANDGGSGSGLWKRDPASASVSLVKSVSDGPYLLTNVGGRLFFGSNGLWTTDGTTAGTTLVKSVVARNLTDVNGTLFFRATSGFLHKVWKSDGTTAGTTVLSMDGNDVRELANVAGTLFFSGDFQSHGLRPQLWKSDGTTAGTVLMKDLPEGTTVPFGAYARFLTNVNGKLFFSAGDASQDIVLWKSDGTSSGTLPVPASETLTASSMRPGGIGLAVAGDYLFLVAADGIHGRELWKTDGTVGGTMLVKDIYPGSSSSSIEYLTSVKGRAFFRATDDGVHRYLWESDGTPQGTVMVKTKAGSPVQFPLSLSNVNGQLFFTSGGVWKTDGTADGTVLVSSAVTTYAGTDIAVSAGGLYYFLGSDGVHGAELWRSDGTSDGTFMLKDIYPGPGGPSLFNFRTINQTVYFSANDGTHGFELWKTDGSSAGTILVKDINPGSGNSSSSGFTEVNGSVYFGANDGVHGYGLWKTDGTEAGTVLVKAIPAGEFATLNGKLYFRGNDGVNGSELWTSDGTPEGTVMIKDIQAGPASSDARSLTNLNGTLIFAANDGMHGYEFWRSDGTADGTYQLPEITPGPAFPFAILGIYVVPFRDSIVTFANDGVYGWEPWTLVMANAAPSFVSADVSATDEDGARVIAAWASGIAAGPPDESGQMVQFVVTGNTNPGIFAVQPSVDASGKLTFTPKANASGTAEVTVVLRDDGGTANGGVDVSQPQTFTITITKPHPWHNVLNAMDVDGDGQVLAADALAVIDLINAFGAGPLTTGVNDGNFYDVNGDNMASPIDALLIINYLNSLQAGGAGESSRGPQPADMAGGTPAPRGVDAVFRRMGDQAVRDQAAVDELLMVTVEGVNPSVKFRPI